MNALLVVFITILITFLLAWIVIFILDMFMQNKTLYGQMKRQIKWIKKHISFYNLIMSKDEIEEIKKRCYQNDY